MLHFPTISQVTLVVKNRTLQSEKIFIFQISTNGLQNLHKIA